MKMVLLFNIVEKINLKFRDFKLFYVKKVDKIYEYSLFICLISCIIESISGIGGGVIKLVLDY